MRKWSIIGVGSGWGAGDMRTADGPRVLMENCPKYFQTISSVLTYWHHKEYLFLSNIRPLTRDRLQYHESHIIDVTTWLSNYVQTIMLQRNIPLVFGGDHSIAVGTWNGVKAAYPREDIGLIWIDAHMDAHTIETSPSLNLHGMPIAILLGYGDTRLIHLTDYSQIFKPQNICLIGIRSFEDEEATFLKQQGVRIYWMEDVQERGFTVIFNEAISYISTKRFGISIDIDVFDPEEAPGTGTLVQDGLKLKDVAGPLFGLFKNPYFLGLEIVEFNPLRDVDGKTSRLIWELVRIINGGTL